ncbi:MAG: hypothetical protein DRP64_10920 [Verrucomicrobia bacterium]|nr:MAG: hypothetical protein DRP64_10920 [Verrucomicrobiota bacterium]
MAGRENMEETRKKKQSNKNWVTIRDVARHCNVGKSTVSRVLNGNLNEFPVSEAMIERVKNAAEELGYRPNWMARVMSDKRTHLIGLSCFYTDSPNRSPDRKAFERHALWWAVDIILSLPEFEDYDLVIHYRKESPDKPLKPSDFKSDLFDGMIYLSPSDEHLEFLDMASEDFPIVLIGQVAGAEERMPCVDINNRKMARQAVDHLIGLGRRNILMLVPEKLKHLNCMPDRQHGYRDALAENGIQIPDESIHTVRCLKDHVDAFFENVHRLEEVDAIFCATDDLAALCIAPLQAMGYRIPEDIALMGFGNSLICKGTSPALSSVHLPEEKHVNTAASLLLKILNKEIPYEPGFHEIEAELVIRESTEETKPA